MKSSLEVSGVTTRKKREREVPAKMVSEIDVGELECPKCGAILYLVHCEPRGHKVREKVRNQRRRCVSHGKGLDSYL